MSESQDRLEAVRNGGRVYSVMAAVERLDAKVDAMNESLSTKIEALTRANDSEHARFKQDAKVGFAKMDGRISAYRLAVIVAWIVLIAVGGNFLNEYEEKTQELAVTLRDTVNVVRQLDKKHDVWEAKAEQWGVSLEKADSEIREQIERIRRDLNRPQWRSKEE